MRIILVILFSILITFSFSQSNDTNLLLDSAKTVFKKIDNSFFDTTSFNEIELNQLILLLENFVEKNPNNPEARYYLGYSYDRLNSFDASTILDVRLNLTQKASKQFEEVIKISPKYKGEIIQLDPYTKLGSIWGTIALKYLIEDKKDSVVWAFSEGKKRGGFADYDIEVHRKVLNACSPNSILIVAGDQNTYSLLYLQQVEKYRTDVTCINATLLNTDFYTHYLQSKKNDLFGVSLNELDEIQSTEWKDSLVTIDDFSWTLKPSYKKYLLRNDLLLLNLLKKYKSKADIYFSKGTPEKFILSLENYVSNNLFVDKITYDKPEEMTYEMYRDKLTEALKLTKTLNKNIQGQFLYLNTFRYDALNTIYKYYVKEELDHARELLEILDKYANEYAFPYENEKAQAGLKSLKDYFFE